MSCYFSPWCWSLFGLIAALAAACDQRPNIPTLPPAHDQLPLHSSQQPSAAANPTAPTSLPESTPSSRARTDPTDSHAASTSVSGYVVHRDSATGELTVPSADEFVGLATVESPGLPPLREEVRGSARLVRLRGRFRSQMVARLEDGAVAVAACESEEVGHDAR